MTESDKQVVERIRQDCARIEGLLMAHTGRCHCFGDYRYTGKTGETIYELVRSILGYAHESREQADRAEQRNRALSEGVQKGLDMATEPLYKKIKEAQEEIALLKRLLRVEQPDVKC